jgi:hypothetical protein
MVTFGNYQGRFAVYVDNVLVGSVWDSMAATGLKAVGMDVVRAAGFNTGNVVNDLCAYLGAEVVAAHQQSIEEWKRKNPKVKSRRFGRGHMQQGGY